MLASSHPHPQAFLAEDAFRDSRGGEVCLVNGQESVPGDLLLVPWWQAAQRGCRTTRRACLESAPWEEDRRPTHPAHDEVLVVLDSMPERGQGSKELAYITL